MSYCLIISLILRFISISIKLYLNGMSISSNTMSYAFAPSSGAVMAVGTDAYANGSTNYQGFLDEIRISKGVARWTSNFTPPVQPYSN